MTHFPHMIAFVLELSKEKKMYDFEDVNTILATCADEGTIEPIDEKDCHPMDWAEVTGLVEEVVDQIYPEIV